MYSILRSFDNFQHFKVLKDSLKYVPGLHFADDSSRIYDGILFKVDQIRYEGTQSAGNYTGNVGVIQDPNISRIVSDKILRLGL